MSVIAKATELVTGQQLMVIVWEGITEGDTGAPQQIGGWVKSAYVQVTGDDGDETLTMQGSIDGTNYFSLTKVDGSTAMTFTDEGGLPIAQLPLYIRPSLSGSADDGDLDVMLLLRG